MWPVCLHPSTTTTTLCLPRATVVRRLQWRPPLLPASRPLASALLPRLFILQSAARASPLFAQPSTTLSLVPTHSLRFHSVARIFSCLGSPCSCEAGVVFVSVIETRRLRDCNSVFIPALFMGLYLYVIQFSRTSRMCAQ
jgi:hypothetical protein